jgi:hypothetical protein
MYTGSMHSQTLPLYKRPSLLARGAGMKKSWEMVVLVIIFTDFCVVFLDFVFLFDIFHLFIDSAFRLICSLHSYVHGVDALANFTVI